MNSEKYFFCALSNLNKNLKHNSSSIKFNLIQTNIGNFKLQSSNKEIIIPETGYYFISYNILFDLSTNSEPISCYSYILINPNDNETLFNQNFITTNLSNNLQSSQIFLLEKGSRLKLKVFFDKLNNIQLNELSKINIIKL